MIPRATLLSAATFALSAALAVGLSGCVGEGMQATHAHVRMLEDHAHAARLTSVAGTGGEGPTTHVEVRRESDLVASAAPVDPAGHDSRHDVHGNAND